ncbi:MAG: hypothetical protein ACPGVO_17275 [Spirulinaceae cyanobacterium]
MNRDTIYLLDIAKLCRTILRLTHTMTEAEFLGDRPCPYAILVTVIHILLF